MANAMIALGVAFLPIFLIAAIGYFFDGIAGEIVEDDIEE